MSVLQFVLFFPLLLGSFHFAVSTIEKFRCRSLAWNEAAAKELERAVDDAKLSLPGRPNIACSFFVKEKEEGQDIVFAPSGRKLRLKFHLDSGVDYD